MPETVTIRDVAERAGVSSGTVSRVLNNHANVAADLRDRVLEAAAVLGYRPPRRTSRGSSLRSVPARLGTARTSSTGQAQARGAELGFLLTLPHLPEREEPMSPFWAHILHGAEAAAQAHGARVRYLSLPTTSAHYRRQVRPMGLDGVLLVGVASGDLVTAAQESGQAVVLVDSQLPEVAVDAVIFDYVTAGRRATEELIRAGHRRIGFVGGPLRSGTRVRCAIPTIESQAIGYRTALAYAGIPFELDRSENCDLTPEGGYAAARRLFARSPSTTAVFCAGDRLATGVMRAAREAGRSIPADLSITSVDDEHAGQTVPPLTTVRLNKEHMGAAAVRRLIGRLSRPMDIPVTTMLPVDMVLRDSVHPPRSLDGHTVTTA